MQLRLPALLALLAVVSCDESELPPAAARTDLVPVQGTHVRLAPMEGAVVAKGYAGFEHTATRSMLRVLEFPTSFAEFLTGFDVPTNLTKQGLAITQREDVPNGLLPGRLLSGRQTGTDGATGTVFLWIFGSLQDTVLVHGTCASDEMIAATRAAVLSAVWDPELEVDLFADLGFSLGTTGGLLPARRFGAMITFTRTGKDDIRGEGEPMLMLGPGPPGEIPDPVRFAEDRMRMLPIDDLRITSREEIVVDGLPGVVLFAQGVDPANGQPRTVYQVVLTDSPGHWLVVGMCHSAFAEEYLPVFSLVAESLVRDPRTE